MVSRNRPFLRRLVTPAGFAVAALLLAATVLSACSAGDALTVRPDVDVGTQTAALPAIDVAHVATAPAEVYDTADVTPVETAYPQASASMAGMPVQPLPSQDLEPGLEPDTDVQIAGVPATGTLGELFSATPPAGRPAAAPAAIPVMVPPAAPPIAQPVISPPVVEPPPVEAPAAAAPMSRWPQLFGGRGDSSISSLPADEADCRRQLKRFDVAYVELNPIDDGGQCQIDHPIKVSAIGKVKMQPAATLRCEMALAVATWTKRELVPSARTRYFTGVKAIHQASSYSCRKIARSRTMSEHAKGNALDIARIELNSGRDIEIEKPGWFAFRTKGLLNNVRADACEYFSTVLGPGYNYDHRDHFHFDIKPRRSTACH